MEKRKTSLFRKVNLRTKISNEDFRIFQIEAVIYVSYEEVLKEIKNLQTAKTTQQNDIPTKILKENSEVFARYFYENINFCIENSILPSDLKLVDVTSAF